MLVESEKLLERKREILFGIEMGDLLFLRVLEEV